MFAVLGNVLFDTLTSPESFRSMSEFTFAKHDVVEAAPRLQWLADDLQKISLELTFHVAFTNPATQMNLLRAAAQAHQANALVFGNGVHRGYFVIESLEETLQETADDGSYIALSARLELREWIPGADFDPAAPPQLGSPPPGILQSTSASGTPSMFDSSSALGAGAVLPTSEITQLTPPGALPGVTYAPADYSDPGVSGLVGSGPGVPTPSNFTSVLPATIVREG